MLDDKKQFEKKERVESFFCITLARKNDYNSRYGKRENGL